MPAIGNMLRDPRIALPAAVTGSVLVAGGGAWFVFDSLLIAMVIALAVALVVLVAMLLTTLRAQDRETVLERGIEERPDPVNQPGVRGGGVAAKGSGIDAGFARALGAIRLSPLGPKGVYALPWLMLIGESNAGKSSALRVSGLDLPPDQLHAAAGRATEECDWWLTNQAIVLDTSGRYLASEESDPGWMRLLKLLRQRRSKGPLDGIVIGVSISSLIGAGAGDFKERARTLRRRINEIADTLEFDIPIYILVTKADLIDGFTDVATVLPRGRLQEALGWTNDQRDFRDARELISEGLGKVRDRLEGLVSEMVLRVPEIQQKRRIFLFPQEFEAASEAVASFIGYAFAPSVYGEVPFLRGVYFASAKQEGTPISTTLRRLGQDWAIAGLAPGSHPDGIFLHDVFRDIVVGDRDLALPARWMGRRTRRVIVGLSAAVAIASVLFTGIAALDQFRLFRALSREADAVVRGASSLPTLDRLRETIERAGDGSARFLGMRSNLGVARERARQTYLWAFGKEFEVPTKKRLLGELRNFDGDAFGALASLAIDVSWLGSHGDGSTQRPDLVGYAPVSPNQADGAAFSTGYDAFVRWLPQPEREEIIDREREAVGSVAGKLLDLQRLDAWCERQQRACPPIRLEGSLAVAPTAPGEPEVKVEGAYTRRIWEGLVRDLIAAVERTGGASASLVRQFREGYTARYDENWRRFLLAVPTEPVRVAPIKDSPYLRVLETIEQNVGADIPRASKPAWVATLESVREDTPPAEPAEKKEGEKEAEKPLSPWRRYVAALDQVAADAAEAESQPGAALQAATQIGEPESSFRRALALVRELVPTVESPRESGKLREILSAPILGSAAGVFEKAMVTLEQKWTDRIAGPYGRSLDSSELRELYAPGEGALDVFVEEALGPFYADGHSRPLLAEQGLPLGENFLRWMDSAEGVKRSLSGGGAQVAVRLEGVPSRVVSGSGIFVTRRDLRVACALDVETFVYREGSGSHAFNWTPDCQEVSLRIWARAADGDERELLPERRWEGPMAFPSFLREAQQVDHNGYQWHLRYADAELIVEYRMKSGDTLLKVAHRPPPASMRE